MFGTKRFFSWDCQNGSHPGAGRVGALGSHSSGLNKSWLPVFVSIPQSMTWSFGWNSSLPVYYMREDRRVILYTCAHTAIMYDVVRNTQYHLQVCRL
jgi:hypothetical protein